MEMARHSRSDCQLDPQITQSESLMAVSKLKFLKLPNFRVKISTAGPSITSLSSAFCLKTQLLIISAPPAS